MDILCFRFVKIFRFFDWYTYIIIPLIFSRIVQSTFPET